MPWPWASPTPAPSPTLPCCALPILLCQRQPWSLHLQGQARHTLQRTAGRQAGGALVPKGYEGAQDIHGTHSNPQTPGPRDMADQPPIPLLPGPWCPFEHGRTHANTCIHTRSLAHCLPSSPGPGRRPFSFSLHRSLPALPGIWVQPCPVPPLTHPQARRILSFKAGRATPPVQGRCALSPHGPPRPTQADPEPGSAASVKNQEADGWVNGPRVSVTTVQLRGSGAKAAVGNSRQMTTGRGAHSVRRGALGSSGSAGSGNPRP